MSNPHWPQFPDVPNMAVDSKGRPNTRDLVPGQQEGTPLSASLFNPIITNICDIRDELDTTLPTLLPIAGGDVTGNLSVQGKIVATINDVNAETNRAQKVEAGLVSGSEGLDAHNIQITAIKAQYSETDATQALGVSYHDKNGHDHLCIDKDYANTLYPSKAELKAETDRAQSAEALLLHTEPVSGSDVKLSNVVWNGDKNLSVHVEGDNKNEIFYPAEKSVQALTYSDAEARPTTIRTLKNGWNGKPQLIVENDGFDAFNGASIEAVNNALSTETSRAQAAENSKLALSGGILTGDLELKGNVSGDKLASKTIHLSAAGVNAHSQIQLLGTKTNPTTAISTIKEDGTSASLFLNADNSVTTARGTSLPEIMVENGQTGRIVMQYFSVTGPGNGDDVTVQFPTAFAIGTIPYVFATATREASYSGSEQYQRGVSLCLKENSNDGTLPAITNTDVHLNLFVRGTVSSVRPWFINVCAIGIMN